MARERIAKRKAEKMVGVRGGAERQREQEAAAHAHSRRQHARCRLASPRGCFYGMILHLARAMQAEIGLNFSPSGAPLRNAGAEK